MNKRTLTLVLLLLGYLPFVVTHFSEISVDPQYQYWPFVIGAFAFLIWARYQVAPAKPTNDSNYSVYLMGFALVLLIAGGLLFAPWLAMSSCVVAIAAILLKADRRVINLGGIWFLLWLTIPLPFGLDGRLVSKLQRLSSVASSQVLDLLRINHLMAGNALEVPGKQFFVDEACSGIVSVMSIISAGVIYVVWSNRTVLHSVLLVGTGILWAVVMNIARIVTIAFVYVKWDIDWSEGSPHTMLGLVLFSFTFIALMSTDQLISFFMAPVPDAFGVDNGLQRWWNRFAHFGDPEKNEMPPMGEGTETPGWKLPIGPGFATAFAVIGLVFGTVVVAGVVRSAPTLQKAESIGETTLPTEFGSWVRTAYRQEHRDDHELFGEFSETFEYESEHHPTLTISFDYPFPAKKGWKELTVCYRSIGWTMTKRELIEDSNEGWNYVRADFENASGQHGALWFCHFDGAGTPLSPPKGAWNQSVWKRTRRISAYTTSPHLFQSQIWVVSANEIAPGTADKITSVFREARNAFRQQFAKTDQ